MSIHVHLHQFEGPLALLLYLIRKEEMDIMDINVHEITKQYLEYIKRMKELDLEVAGDFVAMAATLIHIKSRMLLPVYDDEGEEIEQEDPRKELVQKLLEYQMFQEAGKKLYDRPLMRRDMWARGVREIHVSDDEGEIIVEEGGLFALISHYRRAVKKMKKAVHNVAENTQSIASRIMEIKSLFRLGEKRALNTLITAREPGPKRYQLLITFLSILELSKMGFLSLFQGENFEDIHITPLKDMKDSDISAVEEYDNLHAAELADELIEQAEHEQEMEMEEETVAQVSEPSEEEEGQSIATDEDILAAEAELEDYVEQDTETVSSQEFEEEFNSFDGDDTEDGREPEPESFV